MGDVLIIPVQLPPPRLLILHPRPPGALQDLLLARGRADRRLAAAQADEAADAAALLLQRHVRRPQDRARVLERPAARRALVVEVRQLLQLRVRQQPEVEQRQRERRVDLPRRELH